MLSLKKISFMMVMIFLMTNASKSEIKNIKASTSQKIYEIWNQKKCQNIKQEVLDQLAQGALCTEIDELKKQFNSNNEIAEHVFFEYALSQQQLMLNCKVRKISNLRNDEPDSIEFRKKVVQDIANKLDSLREIKAQIQSLLKEHNSIEAQLKNINNYGPKETELLVEKNKHIASDLNKMQSIVEEYLSSMWGQEEPAMQSYLNNIIDSKMSPEDFVIQAALKDGPFSFQENVLKKMQDQAIEDGVKNNNQYDSNLHVYHPNQQIKESIVNQGEVLAQLQEKLNSQNKDNDLSGLACYLDARYGHGPEYLENTLFMTTMGFGGLGWIAKASTLGKVGKLLSAKNARISLGSAKILYNISNTSANALTIEQISSQCGTLKSSSQVLTGACQDVNDNTSMGKIEIINLNHSNCVLSAALGVLPAVSLFHLNIPKLSSANSKSDSYENLPKIKNLGVSIQNLKPRKFYQIQLNGSSQIQVLKFNKTENGQLYFTDFIGQEVKIDKDKIFELRKGESDKATLALTNSIHTSGKTSNRENGWGSTTSLDSINKDKFIDFFVHGFTSPKEGVGFYKNLTANKEISVVGNLLTQKQTGETVLKNLESFDSYGKSVGFQFPKSTRIIINDKKILPSLQGPYMNPLPLIHLTDLKVAEKTIALNPILTNRNAILDDSILFHERTHSMLYSTYKPNAYVIKNNTIQEALADYFAASHNANPNIGKNSSQLDRSIRDISVREANTHSLGENVIKSRARKSIMDFTDTGYHDNSLIYSNVLWRARLAIGQTQMDQVIKHVVDDLNMHYQSAKISPHLEGAELERANFEYFLSSLRKTFTEKESPAAVQVIDQLANEYGMSATIIKQNSENLTKAGKFDLDRDAISQKQVIAIQAGALSAKAVQKTLEGSLIYTVYDLQNGDDTK